MKKNFPWHEACHKWHVTRHKWHKTHDTLGMVNMMQKLQVPSFYGLGMVEKWHVTRVTRHVTCNTWQVLLSASYIPLENIKLFGYFQTCLSSVKVPNLVEIRFTLYLPDFKNVSSTSVTNAFLDHIYSWI